MKIILTTVYDVDKKWFDWYCAELDASGIPDQIRAASALRKFQHYSFTSSNPEDPKCTATTSYRVER